MLHVDGGLKITGLDLALDMRRRQPRGFISHGHADHMAPHELAFCTPATARFYQRRFGQRLVRELPFGCPFEWDDYRLTTHPAGHILGSAMLQVEGPRESLLFTGDFRLGSAATAEPAAPPHANLLVMECTFGDPRYRLPPREQVIADLVGTIRRIWQSGATPVIYAYATGKSQEVTRILTDRGFRVRQHPTILAISSIYRELGCDPGEVGEYDGLASPEHEVLIMPPRSQATARLPLPQPHATIAVTGWAQDRATRGRWGVDYMFPLSDHADYRELRELVDRVAPQRILCVHGPATFAQELRSLGYDCRWLDA